MKTMRYRIRVVTLLIVIAIFAVVLWNIRNIYFPSFLLQHSPAESSSPSPAIVSSDLLPLMEDTPSTETNTPEPLYDINGL